MHVSPDIHGFPPKSRGGAAMSEADHEQFTLLEKRVARLQRRCGFALLIALLIAALSLFGCCFPTVWYLLGLPQEIVLHQNEGDSYMRLLNRDGNLVGIVLNDYGGL